MRNAFINTIIDACKEREDIFVISGDAGLGVFDDFKETHPDRFLNLGVAEQNMASMAAGMALAGYKVVMYNIIPFLFYRCYEQIRNDICYQELPVIMAGIGSGLTYSPQGMTHYSVEDVALARTLPNLQVISPIDPIEARLAAKYALDAKAPVYVRLAKRGEPDLHKTADFNIREPRTLVEGSDTAILFYGSLGEEALKAAEKLYALGVFPKVISVPFLQPLGEARLGELLKGVKKIVTVEEHYSKTGLGAIIDDFLRRRKHAAELIKLGVADGFIHEILDNAGMRKKFGIDAEGIVRALMNFEPMKKEAPDGKANEYYNSLA
ncbi:MAG: transketolase family protein [Chloroflexota bacterium]